MLPAAADQALEGGPGDLAHAAEPMKAAVVQRKGSLRHSHGPDHVKSRLRMQTEEETHDIVQMLLIKPHTRNGPHRWLE